MRNNLWNRLGQLAAKSPFCFGTGVDRTAIDAAEKQLGAVFDPDYARFLTTYGAGVVGPESIYGLEPIEFLGANWSVVEETRRFQNDDWPDIEGWIVISMDARGNPVGIAPDGRVCMSDHDVGDVPVLGESFAGFLETLLR